MKDYSKENLDVTHYRNGDTIPFVKSKKEWGDLTTGAYCYYDNDPEKNILYNWHAVNDSRGLAPEGWKIPTIEELEQINLTTGLPGGYRSNDGNYDYIGLGGYWWSSTEYNTYGAWGRSLYYDNGDADRNYSNKRNGFSVRCLRDKVIINKSKNMEVIIDGIVYIPKEKDKEVESVILERYYKFEVHPEELGKMTWEEAIKIVKELGDDWRLPTIEECFIMYSNKVITTGNYWSSTEYDGANAWTFYFLNGSAYHFYKINTYYVRAVRSI
jgi:hypothetical protein